MQVKPHAFSVKLPCSETQVPHWQSQERCHRPIESSLGLHSDSENKLAATCLNLIDAFSRDWCKGLGTSCSFGKDLKEQSEGQEQKPRRREIQFNDESQSCSQPWGPRRNGARTFHGALSPAWQNEGRLFIMPIPSSSFSFLTQIKKAPSWWLPELLGLHRLYWPAHRDIQPFISRKDQGKRRSQDITRHLLGLKSRDFMNKFLLSYFLRKLYDLIELNENSIMKPMCLS